MAETTDYVVLNRESFERRPSLFGKPFMLSILCVLIILNVGIWGYGLIRKQNIHMVMTTSVRAASIDTNLNRDKIEIIETSSTTSKPNSQDPDIFGTAMRYTSYQLGITFHYLTRWEKIINTGDKKPFIITVSRNQNRVCISYDIYKSNNTCSNGEYVEIFQKDPNESFQKSINTYFLQNQTDCIVTASSARDNDFIEVKPSRCLGAYTNENRQVYFQYNARFPDKFALISLNQHPILADVNYKTWEKTLDFIGQ